MTEWLSKDNVVIPNVSTLPQGTPTSTHWNDLKAPEWGTGQLSSLLASSLTSEAPQIALFPEQDSVLCPLYPLSPLLLGVSPFYRWGN